MELYGISQQVENAYHSNIEKLNKHDSSVAEKNDFFLDELRTLKNELRKNKLEASKQAGIVGLIYDPGKNCWKLPDDPAFVPITENNTDPNSNYRIASYVISVLIGGFVGNSLFSLLGISKKTLEGNVSFWFMIFVGVAIMLSFKLLLETIWKGVGKAVKLKEMSWKKYLFPIAVSLGIMLAELNLGAFALINFSIKTSFDASQHMSSQTAFLIAVAITSASIIISGVFGFQKGESSVTNADVRNKMALDNIQSYKSRHNLLIKDIKEEKKASYETLLGLIGKIQTISDDIQKIENERKQFQNDSKFLRQNLI